MDFANAIDGQRAMNEVDGDRSKGGLRVREFKPMGNRWVSFGRGHHYAPAH